MPPLGQRLSLAPLITIAVGVVAGVSCSSTKPPLSARTQPPRTPLERLLEILNDGGSLYGLSDGCEEWRAAPRQGEVILSTEDDENADDSALIEDDATVAVAPNASGGRGHISTRSPDAVGRIYGVDYYVMRDEERVRVRLSGRGWHLAPGVRTRDTGQGEFVTFGSASYCSYDVYVGTHPGTQAAVQMGSETWFFTRDACLQSRSSSVVAVRGCAARRAAGMGSAPIPLRWIDMRLGLD